MSLQIKLPDIGSDEVEVTEILVKVGDKVEADQSLLTVEGDKASMEIPAPQAGIVKSISVAVGDKVTTGVDIMVFEAVGAAASAPAPAAATPEAQPVAVPTTANNASADVFVPDIGSDEVEVTEILVKIGDTITADQSLITVEGDKASMEIPAPIKGVVKAIIVTVGSKVKTGSKIMEFATTGAENLKAASTAAPAAAPTEPTAAAPSTPAPAAKPTSVSSSDHFVENEAYAHATPSVRRLAREFGVNLAKIAATGPKSRILRQDIQSYVKNAVRQAESGATASGGGIPGLLAWPKVDFAKFGDIEVKPLTKIQKVSGANLSRNWVMIPHVTEFDETDITDLEAFRKQQNTEAEKRKLDVKYTALVFIIKAVASALVAYPRFNSSLSEDGQSLILKKYVNVGVAVDTPNGLVVPVIKDADKKGITELSRELAEISKKAREGKLKGSDMQGGCFSISSLGGIATTAFTPIVNAPEVAILGVSRSSIKPIWNGKEFTPRLMMPLSLSFDHRVIDGADGARFLSYLTNALADLRRLVL